MRIVDKSRRTAHVARRVDEELRGVRWITTAKGAKSHLTALDKRLLSIQTRQLFQFQNKTKEECISRRSEDNQLKCVNHFALPSFIASHVQPSRAPPLHTPIQVF
jgi:hypothetical protein